MRRLGMLKQSARMSVENILGNRMRSFLTMLGIIIGVTAVISLMTIVTGVTDYMMGQFSSMGADSITVSVTGTVVKSGLTETDLADIEALDNVAGTSPSITVTTNVVREGQISDEVTVTGKSDMYFIHNDEITYGRGLYSTDMDGSVNVCVIDSTCAQTFFLGEDPVGQQIQIGGVQYTVVGICGADDSLLSSFTGGSGDDGIIYIPYKNALLLNGRYTINSLEIYVADTEKTDALVDEVEQLLDNTFNNADDAYTVVNMTSLVDMMNTMQTMMTSLLAGIASIALLVGGIGIMNMMLVSDTERTREIGLRKALGAEPSTIQIQFLMESIILSVLGGIIGILLGELISYAAAQMMGLDFALNVSAIALGFGFSLGVGVLFGWAPARNASRLNPIDALRSE
ncbi:MAG: ABC transporter permease [Clostridiales bacterium]|nr:ABC transporter permease [Clostridiales bacterium]